MLDIQLTMDEALTARLKACHQLFLRLDAGAGPAPLVRLPEGNSVPVGLQPGGGLRAAGVLLCGALLGRETAEPLAAMRSLEATLPDRPFKRLCENAADMLEEAPSWNLASLLSCLRTVMVFLPESAPAAVLPGLATESGSGEKALPRELNARYAWAEDAVIAYFDLPPGIEEARIGETAYTRQQCRAGICLPPDTAECEAVLDGQPALLRPSDPMRGLQCSLGFRIGKFFLPARKTPRRLWARLSPFLRVTGRPGTRVPAMSMISSKGQAKAESCVLPAEGQCFLFCPPLDPKEDQWLEIRVPGIRLVD